MSTVVTTAGLDSLLDALSVAIGRSGRTQKELAAEVGLSEKHVSQMMTGRADGALRSWQALLDAAGLRVEFVITAADRDPQAEAVEHG